MSSVSVDHALILAGILFAIGAAGVMVRRDLVFVLVSVEIMLSAGGLAFVAAGSKWGQPDGQVLMIFVFVAAATGVAVGLSLLMRVYRDWRSVDTDEVSLLKEREAVD